VRARDLEIERLTSEIESKQELARALRRDAESVDRVKTEARLKDKEIAGLYRDQRQAEKRIAELGAELESLRDAAASVNTHEKSELEAVRAELDARKTLIKSLRADADRVATLETRLEEKRDIVAKLEASINKHVETIAELKRSGEMWRKKYQELRSRDPAATSMEIPALSQTDVAALQELERTDVAGENTIAIDMRRPLSEERLEPRLLAAPAAIHLNRSRAFASGVSAAVGAAVSALPPGLFPNNASSSARARVSAAPCVASNAVTLGLK
jgi:predicted RNase H-like nuclease (RuvC/YqgF family)